VAFFLSFVKWSQNHRVT